MESIRQQAGRLSGGVLVFLVVAACLTLGVIGLILPLVPGLLFLAIAAVMLAPYVPALSDWMRRSPVTRRYMEDADRLHTLELGDRLRLGFLMSLRMLIDAARFAAAFLRSKLREPGAQRQRMGSREY